MFSSRTDWNLGANRLTTLLNRKHQQNESVLDLTESNPTRCGLVPGPEFVKRFAYPHILSYDPAPKGLLTARQAISRHYAEREGVSVDPEMIVLTCSTSEGYSFLFRLLCNPGDHILVPRPSYPLFDTLAELHDVRVSRYDLVYDGEWSIDRDSLLKALDSRTRAILLLHPSNPAGSFIKPDEREFLMATAARLGIPLIVDEVFHSFPLDADKNAPTFSGNSGCATVVLNGLSKMAGLPQLKLAWMCFSGPGEWLSEALGRIEVIADTFLSVSTPSQLALPQILGEIRSFSEPLDERIKQNHMFLRGAFLKGCSILRCEGGWNTMIRVPATTSDEEWSLALLERENVLVHPGYLFDVTNGPHVVLSLLPPSPVFRAALERCSRFFAGSPGN